MAFGRISLKDYYSALTEAERDEREEFVVDACYLMRDRFRGEEVFETLGLDVNNLCRVGRHLAADGPIPLAPGRAASCRSSRTSACGATRNRRPSPEMGVLDLAGSNIDVLMKTDEDQAEALDKAHDPMASRALEVDQAIAAGAN